MRRLVTILEEIVSPSDGEILYEGVPVEIRWTKHYTDQPDSVAVHYDLHEDGNWQEWAVFHQVGTPTWEIDPVENEYVATAIPIVAMCGSRVRIKLTFYANGREASRVSTAPFSVYPTPVAYVEEDPELHGVDYEGDPYSTAVFDFNNDGKQDVLVTIEAGGSAGFALYRNTRVTGQNRLQFQDVAHLEFSGQIPFPGFRGLAVAAHDSASNINIFMAHPTDPALYVKKTDNKWHNVIGDPKYFDPAHVEYAQYSYCASWVDINRDGHLDLYVGRGDDFRELRDAVFVRGDVSATPRFAFDHAAFGFGSGDSVSTRAISWADYNGDGLWDLAICGPRAFPGHSPPPTFLYWREEVASTFAVVPVPQFQAAPLTGIFGLWYVEWVDRNQNNGFDLIVASPLDAEETNILVFSHPDAVPTISAIPSNVGGGQAGDIDLDGRPDLVLIGGLATQGDVQRSGPTTVALNVSGHPNFDQEFILTGTALGLEGANEQKFARTLALADFGGDGDLDLVLGIPDASNFSGRVKRAVAPDGGQAPRNNWLGVRLVGQAEDNPWGIGATISLSAGGLPLGSQVVQGGGGRGGQTSPTRVFGLGSHSGNVQAEVRWPLGFVQEFDINASNLNSVVSVIQSVGCNLIDTSVKCEIVFQPGGSITWVFTWTTDRWTKRTEDRVTISRQQGSDCGFEGMTLQASADDNIKVEPVQYLTAGEYKHEVRWENQTCHPACTYTYYVRSWDGRFTGTEVISSTRQLRLRVCPQAQ